MSATVSLPSQSLHNFSFPPSKYTATATYSNHFTAHNLSTTSQQNYSFFSSNGFVDKITASGSTDSHHHQRHHPAVETSETKPAATNGRPKIVIKFRTKNNNNNTNDGVPDAVDQTLAITRKDEECEKVKTSEMKSATSGHQRKIKIKLGKRSKTKTEVETLASIDGNAGKKRRTFSISLTKEEIEADRIAMGVGELKQRKMIMKRSKSVQKVLNNLFLDSHLKSISLDDYRV